MATLAQRRSPAGPRPRALRGLWTLHGRAVYRLRAPEEFLMPKGAVFAIGLLGGAVAAIGVLSGIEKLNEFFWGK